MIRRYQLKRHCEVLLVQLLPAAGSCHIGTWNASGMWEAPQRADSGPQHHRTTSRVREADRKRTVYL